MIQQHSAVLTKRSESKTPLSPLPTEVTVQDFVLMGDEDSINACKVS